MVSIVSQRKASALLRFGLCATLIFVACTSVTGLPTGSEHFEPPSVYGFWWTMTEECSGLTGSLADVAWFVVPNADTVSDGVENVQGYWTETNNTIVLAGNSQLTGSLVRHEMLHALLRSSHHPRLQFLGRCAGVVACIDQCIMDAGPPVAPPAGTPQVSSDSLEVTVTVTPADPGGSKYDGFFSVIVTARNPANHAIEVILPPSGDDGPSATYSWSVRNGEGGLSSGDRAYDPSVRYFLADETKQDVADLRVGPQTTSYGEIVPGEYTIVGAYGRKASAALQISLSP
jgi:hypothetical protein